jgi:hypothetical protein
MIVFLVRRVLSNLSATVPMHYRARALSEPRHKSSHEHHAYYYKDEVIVTTTKAIIAGFFGVATL